MGLDWIGRSERCLLACLLEEEEEAEKTDARCTMRRFCQGPVYVIVCGVKDKQIAKKPFVFVVVVTQCLGR
jgi:hypothetical protein